MKSPRPPAKSRLPRRATPSGGGQSMRRSGQPSGARPVGQDARRRDARAGAIAHCPSAPVTVWKATPSSALPHEWGYRTLPGCLLALLAACCSLARRCWWRSGARAPSRTGSTAPSPCSPFPSGGRPASALWPDVALQIGVAFVVFACSRSPSRFGAMGGGDVKLIGALALVAALAGGADAARDHVARRRRADARDADPPPAARSARGSSKFPTASRSLSAVLAD